MPPHDPSLEPPSGPDTDLDPAAGAEQAPTELVSELAQSLERAGKLLKALREQVPPHPSAAGGVGDSAATGQVTLLRDRLSAAESDLVEISTRLVDTENQRSRLMNLYVATYQLHATLDLEEVKATIAEIARDLLGAERFVLLLREEAGTSCEVALAEGFEPGQEGFYRGGRYRGGDLAVDKTLADGVMRMNGDSSAALAAVPLKVQGAVVGAVVILKLFDHKPSLDGDDRDLLDLLAAHAASALFAARVYSNTDRKLRTLESLVKLVR